MHQGFRDEGLSFDEGQATADGTVSVGQSRAGHGADLEDEGTEEDANGGREGGRGRVILGVEKVELHGCSVRERLGVRSIHKNLASTGRFRLPFRSTAHARASIALSLAGLAPGIRG